MIKEIKKKCLMNSCIIGLISTHEYNIEMNKLNNELQA